MLEEEETVFKIDYKETFFEDESHSGSVLIRCPNEIQAEVLFNQDYDSALYKVLKINEFNGDFV